MMLNTILLFVKVCHKGNDSLSNYVINYFKRLKLTSWGPFSLHTDDLGRGGGRLRRMNVKIYLFNNVEDIYVFNPQLKIISFYNIQFYN